MRCVAVACTSVLLVGLGCGGGSAVEAVGGDSSAMGGAGGSAGAGMGGAPDGGAGGSEVACDPPTAPDSSLKARLDEAWGEQRLALASTQMAALGGASPNPYVNYNTQIFTASLLMYAEYQRDVTTLAELAELYDGAFDHIAQQTSAIFYYATHADGGEVRRQELSLPGPAWMWTYAAEDGESVGDETILASSQFLYATTRLSRIAAELGDDAPPALAGFAQRALPIALDHYLRWVSREVGFAGHFQVRGWGCGSGTFDHGEHLQNLLTKSYVSSTSTSYCNAVTDTDIWIVAGILELLVAHTTRPSWVELTTDIESLLGDHVALGLTLFESRLLPATVKDGADADVDSLNFELGTWDDHPGYSYAGYAGATYPGWTDAGNQVPALPPSPTTDVGWDISHARRLVRVLDTFTRFGTAVGSSWPTRDTMVKLARQFSWGTWNRSTDTPQFANFMDGTNGWYRVNYANRAGFGYPPYGLTSSALDGGYGLWSYLEPGLHPLLSTAYENNTYDIGEASDRAALVMILPSIAPYSLDEVWCDWDAIR